MTTKIKNISGVDYGDRVEFNANPLSQTLIVNGFPVNTETYPSGTNYIWSFYTASTRENSDPDGDNDDSTQLYQDFYQEITYNDKWVPRGWYNYKSPGDVLDENGDVNETRDIIGNQRAWQFENRLGIYSEYTSDLERILGYHNESSESFNGVDSASLYSQEINPGGVITDYILNESGSDEDNLGWINGQFAVFPTKLATGSTEDDPFVYTDVDYIWNEGTTSTIYPYGTKGYAMGNYASSAVAGFFGVSYGTPSPKTGPRGAPPPSISPLNHPTASIHEYNAADEGKDRFLHAEYHIPPAGTQHFVTLRTPQRVFNFHPTANVTRKFVGFFYHAYSISGTGFTKMGEQQPIINTIEANGNESSRADYIITVWATQYRRSSTHTHSYTHPGTGNVYNDKLVHHTALPGPGDRPVRHRVFLQPKPTFLGGVKSDVSSLEPYQTLHGPSDLGEFNPDNLNVFDRGWAEFPTSGSDWKSKVLEIPSGAFDYGGLIIAEHDLNSEPEIIHDSNPGSNTGIYIYVVTSPPGDAYSDIAICNLQIAEYDNALVPQSVLDQLDVGVVDLRT